MLIDIFYEENKLLAPDNRRKSHVYQCFHFEKSFGQFNGDRAAACAGGMLQHVQHVLECCLVLWQQSKESRQRAGERGVQGQDKAQVVAVLIPGKMVVLVM